MKKSGHPESRDGTIELHLTASDLQILDKYRGELTRDMFVSSLLRMIDSGAVSSMPAWAKKKKN
jgi:hypothetical protein